MIGQATPLKAPESAGVHAGWGPAVFAVVLATLAATGLPQRFESFPPGGWVMDAAGGIEHLRTIHHFAGAALIAVALHHVILQAKRILLDRDLRPLALVPDGRDVLEAMGSVMSVLGLRRRRPEGGRRPGYFEKLDYWLLAWGGLVMAVSGLMRLYPVRAADLFSTSVVDAALRAHSDVGPLLALWFLLIHLGYLGAARSADRDVSEAPGEPMERTDGGGRAPWPP